MCYSEMTRLERNPVIYIKINIKSYVMTSINVLLKQVSVLDVSNFLGNIPHVLFHLFLFMDLLSKCIQILNIFHDKIWPINDQFMLYVQWMWNKKEFCCSAMKTSGHHIRYWLYKVKQNRLLGNFESTLELMFGKTNYIGNHFQS